MFDRFTRFYARDDVPTHTTNAFSMKEYERQRLGKEKAALANKRKGIKVIPAALENLSNDVVERRY